MADRVGQRLGNYRLIRLLGRGGFAEVYLGEHIFLGTQAAIKVLQMQVTGSDTEHFLTEARTIARLKHPHIISVLEFGMEDDTPFLVMEYAPNGSLRQRHPRGVPIPLATIVPYVNQAASALQYAHDQRLVHRDIKPENMLLGPNNEIMLSDFGIATIAQTTRYQTQEVIGTVAYMAPEQLQGKPRPASDQYSLGVVIYEWLGGTCPFQGSFTEVASQHVLVPPPPIHEKAPGISPFVEQVVMTALAKDPQQRFATIRAFANALEQAWQADQYMVEDIPPPPPGFRADGTRENVQISTSSSSKPFPEKTVLAGQNVLPSSPEPPSRRRSLPASILVLSTILALLIIGVSVLVYYATVVAPGQQRAQATVVAQTATSLTAVAQDQATATASSPQGIYALATSGTPVLNDALSTQSSNRWDEYQPGNAGGCIFNGGGYHVSEFQKNFYFACYAEATNFSDFAFQVQMTIIKGNGGGLIFRAGDTTKCKEYVFFVNGDASYNLSYYPGCSSGQTLDNGGIPSFNTGLNQSNLITVIVRGNTFYLYVNKQLIRKSVDSTYSSGKIGVIANNVANSTEVVYTDAQVWKL